MGSRTKGGVPALRGTLSILPFGDNTAIRVCPGEISRDRADGNWTCRNTVNVQSAHKAHPNSGVAWFPRHCAGDVRALSRSRWPAAPRSRSDTPSAAPPSRRSPTLFGSRPPRRGRGPGWAMRKRRAPRRPSRRGCVEQCSAGRAGRAGWHRVLLPLPPALLRRGRPGLASRSQTYAAKLGGRYGGVSATHEAARTPGAVSFAVSFRRGPPEFTWDRKWP